MFPRDFEAVFLRRYSYPNQNPKYRYAPIPELAKSYPFPAIAIPLDNGPDVLSISPAGHGSATRTLCVRRRARAG